MDPERKRKIRLVVALSAAVLLGAGLVYTSFSASSEARQPSEVLGEDGGPYELTDEVVRAPAQGTIDRFVVADREDPSARIAVEYSGTVPDPFREGREVIVRGDVSDGVFLAERDSLVTKCPSKFEEQAEADPEHVVIE